MAKFDTEKLVSDVKQIIDYISLNVIPYIQDTVNVKYYFDRYILTITPQTIWVSEVSGGNAGGKFCFPVSEKNFDAETTIHTSGLITRLETMFAMVLCWKEIKAQLRQATAINTRYMQVIRDFQI